MMRASFIQNFKCIFLMLIDTQEVNENRPSSSFESISSLLPNDSIFFCDDYCTKLDLNAWMSVLDSQYCSKQCLSHFFFIYNCSSYFYQPCSPTLIHCGRQCSSILLQLFFLAACAARPPVPSISRESLLLDKAKIVLILLLNYKIWQFQQLNIFKKIFLVLLEVFVFHWLVHTIICSPARLICFQ